MELDNTLIPCKTESIPMQNDNRNFTPLFFKFHLIKTGGKSTIF